MMGFAAFQRCEAQTIAEFGDAGETLTTFSREIFLLA